MAIINFIDEALDKIENPKEVNCIKTCISNVEGKIILAASKIDGEEVKVSEGQGRLTFPFEPLLYLRQELGRSYFKNFVDVGVISGNCYCVNRDTFKNFTFNKGSNDSKYVDIVANFHNGQSEYLYGFREKYFNKTGKDSLLQIENEIRDYQIEKGIITEEVETEIDNNTVSDDGMDM